MVWAARATQVGTWLSLVERTLGVGEVASSNLVVPTIISSSLAPDDLPRRALARGPGRNADLARTGGNDQRRRTDFAGDPGRKIQT